MLVYFVVCCGILCYFYVFCSILKYFVEFCGIFGELLVTILAAILAAFHGITGKLFVKL